jgi:Xaa-Pro aminopeptidase
MDHPFRSRIARLVLRLTGYSPRAALILSSNPTAVRSADQHYKYRPNSDLFYLSGILGPDVSLLVRNFETPRVLLIVPPRDPVKVLWEGEQEAYAPVAKKIGAGILRSKHPQTTLKEHLKGAEVLFTQSIPGTTSYSLRSELTSRPLERLGRLPSTFADSEKVLAALRLYKDPSEIREITECIGITGAVLRAAVPLITTRARESDLAHFIDYYYGLAGGEPAFGTIVASGASAATLHYHQLKRTMRSGDLLLIDTGIERGLYSSDISRTVPVGGTLSGAQEVLYEAVLAAQKAAIKKVKHGALIRQVYLAAAKELTLGLKELGILQGTTSRLMAKEAYKPYFPHGIGHSLGLDVHDVGGLRGNTGARLEKSMVFTIEPGLYLPKPTKHLPACGVRIEDDVVVTDRGCKVLSEKAFPKELRSIRELL